MLRRLAPLLSLSLLAACSPVDNTTDSGESEVNTIGSNALNLAAGSMVLYEVQARAANACDPDVGSAEQRAACSAKVAPKVKYRAEGMTCNDLRNLDKIKLGTLDDMLEDTADYKKGITLRYVKERVGANTVWLMPLFPNNDTWNIPDACDNLGSPYAVRDYMHASGMLSRACIQNGHDEHDESPCWANNELDRVIEQAHSRGLRVMLDVALNHFGHNYQMYDYGDYKPIRERAMGGEDLNGLWDFNATFEEQLLRPELLDSPAKLEALASSSDFHRKTLESLKAKCPALVGYDLVRGFNAYREALDPERGQFSCDVGKNYLEVQAPGFYTGSDGHDPSRKFGDNFTNNWRDVKFLNHHEENRAHFWEFARTREYMFRIMNYWTSRGVDGFRLDHTTDGDSGMGGNEWKYLTNKVAFYAEKRGQKRPVYLAEEFADQMEMNKVVDIMTEGYVGDMNGRGGKTKNTQSVENVLENMRRFDDHAFTMTALETHDEHRLLTDTGFNIWTGAGFWGIGASTRSTPMILMGQEFGETYGLGFRKSDYLRSRFVGHPNFNESGSALVDLYGRISRARLANENRALLSPNHWYLRTRDNNGVDPRIFAQAKWSDDANVVFVFHNLWEVDVAQAFFLPPELAGKLHIDERRQYKLVDVLGGKQLGECHSGADLKVNLYVAMDRTTRMQWVRLETCN